MKFYLLIAFLSSSIYCLSAQIITNDSLHTAAKWKAGESYSYKLDKYQYKKVNGKELETSSQSIINLDIDSSTDSTFLIKIKVDSYVTERNPSNKAVLEAFNRDIVGMLEFKVKTNEHGRLLGIENWKNIMDTIQVSLRNWKVIQSMDVEQRNQALLVFNSMSNSKTKIEELFSKEYAILFTNYGFSFNVNKPLQYQDQIPNPYSGKPLAKNGIISLRIRTLDSHPSIILTDQSSIDKEAGKQVMIDLLKQLTKDHQIVEEELRNMVFSLTDTLTQEFDLMNGALLSASLTRRLHSNDSRNEKTQIISQKWSLISNN